MATFTEDFTRMREEFDQSHDDRIAFVQKVRDDTAEMRQEHQGFMHDVLKPFAADLKAGGEIFRGGAMG